MALLDLWKSNKALLADKLIHQVIAFAGDGKIGDSSSASQELRDFLNNVPSEWIGKYANQCLQDSFPNSGFALQDIVNEIGRRLDFDVQHGRYRGTHNIPGHDGIWSDSNGFNIVIEVKTTDAYRIDLNTIANYRLLLSKSQQIALEQSSMLLVVGRQDTGDLEAQIRGSRHAWDMRIISVEALLRMLQLKEELEDPSIITRIHEILIPKEFTRLDPIIDIAFSAVEDAKNEVLTDADAEINSSQDKKFKPVSFHQQCVDRIEKYLNITLAKKTRATFTTSDGSTRVLCTVSRLHEKEHKYWFAFHPHQDKYLGSSTFGVEFILAPATQRLVHL